MHWCVMTFRKYQRVGPLAERYTESISLPVHEQLARYAERLPFVQNLLFVHPPFVCPSTWGSVITL